MKRMNITLPVFFAAILSMLIIPVIAAAHAPENIAFSYSQTSQMLTVTIMHDTPSPKSHYIKSVTFTKNGQPAGSYTYHSQPTTYEASYSYKIPAKIGDKIELTASCSVSGSKTVKWTVKAQQS
jgi:hypothetical protein